MNEKFQISNFNIQSLHINQFASLTQTLLLKCLYQARKMSDHVCEFQGYQFSFYHFILYFTFLFSLCVYASATGQYNVIWSFGPYNIFLMTYRSIHFHMTLSAMNYLLYSVYFLNILHHMYAQSKYIGKPNHCNIKVFFEQETQTIYVGDLKQAYE